MRRSTAAVVAVVVVVLIAGGAGYFYFFSGLRTAPKPLALPSPSPNAASSTPASSASTGPVALAGTWTVGQGSQAGYRVREQFAGQSSPHEAVARTNGVSGGLAVEQQSSGGFQANDISFTTQLANLQSVDQVAGYNVSQRDRIVSRTLDVQQFPAATFKAGSVAVPQAAASGQQVELSVPGQLTIHGVTRPATATVEARVNGTQLQVAGSVPIVMTDFGISPPQVPITTVQPNVTIEFQLVLTKSS